MLSDFLSNPVSFLIGVIAFLTAITIHEFSHAYMADLLGDPNPRINGRLTLNPFAHLDPLGTLMLFLVRFGWSKPVEFDPFNLKNPRRDTALISLAGPLSNLMLAFFLSMLIRFSSLPFFAYQLIYPIIWVNIMLAVFNLLPIHPLDGFKIVGGLLSFEQAKEWYTLERYGFLFLLLLIFPFGSGQPFLYLIVKPLMKFFIVVFLGEGALYF